MPKPPWVGATGLIAPADQPTAVVPRQRGGGHPAEPRASTPARLEPLVWAVPALLTIGLGAWRLTTPALWADELATWGAVRLSWDQLWQLSGTVDAVLWPFYAAMKVYVTHAGTSTAALRLPALLAAVATTLVVTALGRRLGGPATGLLAGLFYAVLPVTSRFAQEARSYAIVVFAAALAVLCLIRLIESPTVARAAGCAGALALASLSHPLGGLLVLCGQVVAVALLRVRGRALWTWLLAALAGGLPAGLVLMIGYRDRTQISWIRLLTMDAVQLVVERIFLSGAVGGIVLALAVVAVRRRREQLCLAAAGFVPVVGLLAVGAVAPVWAARYVLVALPALAALAASAAVRFGRGRAVAVLVVTAVLGFPAQLDVRDPAGHSQDSARIAEVIPPLYRPGDVAVFPDTHPSIPWAPRDIYERYLSAPRPPDVLRVTPQRTDGRFLATECADAACLGDPPRIWVIRVDNLTDPFRDMSPGKQKRLSEHYKPVRRWMYPLLGITLLERRTP